MRIAIGMLMCVAGLSAGYAGAAEPASAPPKPAGAVRAETTPAHPTGYSLTRYGLERLVGASAG